MTRDEAERKALEIIGNVFGPDHETLLYTNNDKLIKLIADALMKQTEFPSEDEYDAWAEDYYAKASYPSPKKTYLWLREKMGKKK